MFGNHYKSIAYVPIASVNTESVYLCASNVGSYQTMKILKFATPTCTCTKRILLKHVRCNFKYTSHSYACANESNLRT